VLDKFKEINRIMTTNFI